MMTFKAIHSRAATRKGGAKALARFLPDVPPATDIAALGDDRVLAQMTKRIFCSGFVWRVIEQKWPAFEEAFHGFEVGRLCFEPDDYWEALTQDARIVRHAQKIMSVRHNARFVANVAGEHGSFGAFLAAWPADDQIGLLGVLGKRGKRLGGMTGQYFLRFIGWDGFVLSRDVVACLRDAGLEISETPSSKKELKAIQDTMTTWSKESGLPVTHVSRICALSIGDNIDPERIKSGGED
ncbi:MAG: DNA-3-methyladenine glycosylase I [Hyphomicrobiaceae bacterium]